MENKAVLVNKYEIVERCINRINEEYNNDSTNLDDYKKMDAIVLNLQRACQMVMDTAMYVVTTRKLGLPQTNKEAFILLEQKNMITKEMCNNMKGMIGFRNIAVHEYKNIDEEIVEDVIKNHLNDLKEFIRCMINL